MNLLFSADVFDFKRHKNLDRHTKSSAYAQNDLDSAPQAVFNAFALGVKGNGGLLNVVEDWPVMDEEMIERVNKKQGLIKEIPKSQQIKRKKKQ